MKNLLAAIAAGSVVVAAWPAVAQEAPAVVAAPVAAQEAPAAVAAQEATPPLRYPPSSVRIKLIGGGLALTTAAWGLSYLSASAWSDVPGATALKVPVVGPWVSLAQNDCAPSDPDCGFTLYLRGFLLILDGVAQAGGLGIAGEGVFMTTEAVRPQTDTKASAFVVRPVPIVTSHETGLGLVGSF